MKGALGYDDLLAATGAAEDRRNCMYNKVACVPRGSIWIKERTTKINREKSGYQMIVNTRY